jgi:hemolysin D
MAKNFLDIIDTDESHPLEGVEIMTRPQPFITKLFLLMLTILVIAMFLLATYGKTDIIVASSGFIASAKPVQKVYTPVGGEIVDLFVSEGAIVSEGDILARIRSRNAIQMAAASQKKKIQKEKAIFESKVLWPEKKRLILQGIEAKRLEIAALKAKLSSAKERYNNLPSTTRLTHKQLKMALNEAQKEHDNHQLTVKEAQSALEKARQNHIRYQHLYEISAVSREDFEEKKESLEEKKYAIQRERNNSKTKKNQIAKTQLKLDSFLMDVGSRLQMAQQKIQKFENQINQFKLDILRSERQLTDQAREVNQKLKFATIDYETMTKVEFENIDSEQCLKLLAPYDGEITNVAISQVGEIVKLNTPLISIGPINSEKTLKIKVRNRDRGLIKIGQSVKVKLDAFPYQRYGMLPGKLEYISVDVVPDKQLGPSYLARVKLTTDKIIADNNEYLLNYGMTAKAEIVVRKQRLIQYLLDPFKKMKKN